MEKKPRWVDVFLGLLMLLFFAFLAVHTLKEILFIYEYFRI